MIGKAFENVRQFQRNESGAAIVEYGLALLVVASISIVSLQLLGSTTNTNVQSACTAVQAAC